MNRNRLIATLVLLALSLVATGDPALAQQPASMAQESIKQHNKQTVAPAVASNPVAGSGTPGQLTKWTGVSSSSTIGDSNITEDKFGKVGIGTRTPTSPLTVQGMIETTLGGIKFPDGTTQTTSTAAALFGVAHDATLQGNGTGASPLGVGLPLNLSGSSSGALLKVVNLSFGEGVHGEGIQGVFGKGVDRSGNGGIGVVGLGGHAEIGSGGFGAIFVGGNSLIGVGGVGLRATGGTGDGFGHDGLAGDFAGDVDVSGNLHVSGTTNVMIDHPLDPENKYLHHAGIESSEVLNLYSGNATTDASGEAVVTLPEWFQALNKDLRYQLTVIGTFAQAIVAEKVKNNRFTIRTNAPGVEVSWLVTGIRSDAVMLKHPFRAEENKPERERGHYLNPEAYGHPEEKGVEWARNPELMQRLKQQRLEAEEKMKNQQQR